MSYSTLQNSGVDLQRKREQIKRKWHFIGRAYVCHKGGFQHEHVSEDDFRSCNGEDMKTKREKEHEKYLQDKALEIAETNAKAQRDLIQAKQIENDNILQTKEKDLQVGIQEMVNEERRASSERQTMKMKQDHEIKMKKLEMEQQAKSHKLEEKKIKVEENKANNIKDLLAILKHKNQSTNQRAIEDRQSERPQIHIDPSTGSFEITTNNDAVPSAINRLLFN